MQNLNKPIVMSIPTTQSSDQTGIDKMLQRTGQNTGNLLFSVSTEKLFDHGRRVNFSDPLDNIDKHYDCVVVAAANWLNDRADFSDMARRLEATDLPIIVLGLGAQSPLNRRMPKLTPGNRRLVSLLAERSPLISARGEFSCEVLSHYGAQNAVATGCPSLLLMGDSHFLARDKGKLSLDDRDVVIHGTRHHFNDTDSFQTYLYRQAFVNDFDILIQSELADLCFMQGESVSEEVNQKATNILMSVYDSQPSKIRDYLTRKGRVFFELPPWLDYARTKKFFLGTRIHGTIAAIIAGTPAMLIVHDSRTFELAEAMGIPYLFKDQIDVDKPLPLAELYNYTLEYDFHSRYRQYWNTFRDFFNQCGLNTNLYKAEAGDVGSGFIGKSGA